MACVTKDLTKIKDKMKLTQPIKITLPREWRKLDDGKTVVCYICHKKGHKFYQCKVKNKREIKGKLSNMYTIKLNKKATIPYFLKKKWQSSGYRDAQASQHNTTERIFSSTILILVIFWPNRLELNKSHWLKILRRKLSPVTVTGSLGFYTILYMNTSKIHSYYFWLIIMVQIYAWHRSNTIMCRAYLF